MQVITNFREGAPANAWWGDPNKEGVGDLVRMSYLEDVAKFQDTNIVNFKHADKGNQSVDLYLFGDSYTMDIPQSAYYGVRSFSFARRDYTHIEYNLDKTQKNILLIEISERFFRAFYNRQNQMSEI